MSVSGAPHNSVGYSPGRWDVQDDADYWNVPSRVLTDTGRLPHGYDPMADPMSDEIHRWCMRHAVPDTAPILEFGCGGGRLLMLWEAARTRYRTSWKLHGLDHAENAVKLAQTRTQVTTYHTGDISTITGLSRFDVIFTHTALQHNSGWKQNEIYPHFYRLLTPGGRLWLINEKTFDDAEVLSISGEANPMYCDDRASAGTAKWWVSRLDSFGFRMLEAHNSSYTFMKE